MRITVGIVAVALFVAGWTGAAAQPARGSVGGDVTDSSGGVLPGVTVVAIAAGGQLLATTVTDSAGHYELRALPPGRVTLTFDLEGFAGASVTVVVPSGNGLRHVQRLALASVSETVVVRAPAPVAAAPRYVPPPPPPPPVLQPVPEHDRDSICGPAKPAASPESLGTIQSARDQTAHGLFAKNAELVIKGGVPDGMDVGRNLVVRRYYRPPGSDAGTIAEHTAGLIQIVAAGEDAPVGVAVYVCDELRTGDFLAPFTPEPIREPDPPGDPAYYDAALILFADEGQILGVPRRMMVIDRGTVNGIHVGQRFTLFRRGRAASRPESLGDATVVAVRPDSATIRVDRATDAISAGDWAAPQIQR